MRTDFSLEYLQRKLRELGIGSNYMLDFKDVVVTANATVTIDAANHIYLLVDGFADTFRISSSEGVYDYIDNTITENKHEHSGTITITNRVAQLQHLQFIVAIPLNDPQPGVDIEPGEGDDPEGGKR